MGAEGRMAEPLSNPVGRKSAVVTTLAVVNYVLGGLTLALSSHLLWLGLGLLWAVVTGHLLDAPPATDPVTPITSLSNWVADCLTPVIYVWFFILSFLLLA